MALRMGPLSVGALVLALSLAATMALMWAKLASLSHAAALHAALPAAAALHGAVGCACDGVGSAAPRGRGYAQSARLPPLLDSGWDDFAWRAYRRKATDLRPSLLPESRIVSVRMPPLGEFRAVSGRGEFWERVNGTRGIGERGWEPETRDVFFHYITARTTVLDFGTWIGPTILYAAQLARRTFGVEADPCAFATAEVNVKLNLPQYAWAHSIHLQPACVGVVDGPMKMASLDLCNSGSALGLDWRKAAPYRDQANRTLHEWHVQCYSLPRLFAEWEIALDGDTFIKMDVESFECQLLPAVEAWFKSALPAGAVKPTMYLSMHGFMQRCSVEQYEAVQRLMASYRFTYCFNRDTKTAVLDTVTGAFLCHSPELIVSDVKPPNYVDGEYTG
jgi:FkbM family methyltransferase